MALLIKLSPDKYENLGSTPQDPHKKPDGMSHTPNVKPQRQKEEDPWGSLSS